MSCRRKPFLKLTTDDSIDHSGGYERHQLGTDLDPVLMCIAFVRNDVMFFLALYRVFKSMEPLYFDSPAETNVVRRFRTTSVFVSVPVRNRTRTRSSHWATRAPYISFFFMGISLVGK